MGKRTQKRLKVVLPVRVSGTDANGRAFSELGHTLDINGAGVRLGSLPLKLNLDDVVSLQYRVKKARFVVKWIGPAGTPVESQLGLVCLENVKDFWPVSEIQSILQEPHRDDFEPGQKHLNGGRGKREGCACSGTIELRATRAARGFKARITELHSDFCYVETAAGLPPDTAVAFFFRIENIDVEGTGVIRTCYPGEGMDVQFSQFTGPGDRERLKTLMNKLRASAVTQ